MWIKIYLGNKQQDFLHGLSSKRAQVLHSQQVYPADINYLAFQRILLLFGWFICLYMVVSLLPLLLRKSLYSTFSRNQLVVTFHDNYLFKSQERESSVKIEQIKIIEI